MPNSGPPLTTLRTPTLPDYAALASWVPDAQSCLRWAGPRLVFPLDAAGLPAALHVDGGLSHVLAKDTGPALGFGQHWVVTPGAVHLGRIIVSPAARGTGLGRRLCECLIEHAVRHTGAQAVTLRVYRDNTAACRLYGHLGFLPVQSECTEDVLFMKAAAKPGFR